MTPGSPAASRPGGAAASRPGGPAWRELRYWLTAYRRTWRGSIWSTVLSPLFYLGAMGFGLGSLVDRHGTSSLGGVPYLAFLAPAVLATTAMSTAIGEATFPVFGALKWNRSYLGARATPLRPGDIHRGHLLFMIARITLNAMIFLVVLCAFGAARSGWVVLALPAAVLTGAAFAAPVAAFAILARNESVFNYVFRFGMVPLSLFSGTFFPLSQLPGWLRPVAEALPLWHGVALCRALSLGRLAVAGSWPGVAGHVGYLVLLAGAGLWAGNRSYRRRLYV